MSGSRMAIALESAGTRRRRCNHRDGWRGRITATAADSARKARKAAALGSRSWQSGCSDTTRRLAAYSPAVTASGTAATAAIPRRTNVTQKALIPVAPWCHPGAKCLLSLGGSPIMRASCLPTEVERSRSVTRSSWQAVSGRDFGRAVVGDAPSSSWRFKGGNRFSNGRFGACEGSFLQRESS